MAEKDSFYLSKSLYLRGLRCPKSLYLYKYHSDLLDEESKTGGTAIQAGLAVGDYAKNLFPEGIEIPYDGLTIPEQVAMTKEEIRKGTSAIYEAAFSYNGIFVKVDILHKGLAGWEICEIKSSTSMKDVFLDDAAIQYYVTKKYGLQISKISVVHINNKYTRNGDVEPNKLFVRNDVTYTVIEKQESIAENISKLRGVLKSDMPVADIGAQCEEPYPCDFRGYCWKHIPKDSVFDLKGRGLDKFGFYQREIVEMKDLPLDSLNKLHRIQVESFLAKADYLNRNEVKIFLDSLWYPLHFFDFETIFPAIPMFNGTRPYQQIPFQYSLHFIQQKGALLQHLEFLAQPSVDHRKELLVQLLNDIPEDACILAYNSNFEIQVLNNLALQFPEFKSGIDIRIANMRDLADPFRKRDIYSWKMKGSYSLKTVLPVLIPELNYAGLEISDGGMAMEAYFAMCQSDDPVEKERTRKALHEYCKLDTLAMVRILDRLYEISE